MHTMWRRLVKVRIWKQLSGSVTVISSIKSWTFQYPFPGNVNKTLAEKLDKLNRRSYIEGPGQTHGGVVTVEIQASGSLVRVGDRRIWLDCDGFMFLCSCALIISDSPLLFVFSFLFWYTHYDILLYLKCNVITNWTSYLASISSLFSYNLSTVSIKKKTDFWELAWTQAITIHWCFFRLCQLLSMTYPRLQLDGRTPYLNAKETTGSPKVSIAEGLGAGNGGVVCVGDSSGKPPHCWIQLDHQKCRSLKRCDLTTMRFLALVVVDQMKNRLSSKNLRR